MGIIPYNPEERVVENLPNGIYDLACQSVVSLLDANGESTDKMEDIKTIVLLIEAIVENEDWDNTIFHRISIPSKDDSAKDYKRNVFFLEKAAEAFGVDTSDGINPDDFVGKAARGFVVTVEGKTGGFFTNIKKFILSGE